MTAQLDTILMYQRLVKNKEKPTPEIMALIVIIAGLNSRITILEHKINRGNQ